MTYAELITEMLAADPRVTESQMFGMPILKVGKKAFVGRHKDRDVVFKLGPGDIDAALKLPGAQMFEPMPGRPMNGWVVVPHAGEWSKLGHQALKFVGDQV